MGNGSALLYEYVYHLNILFPFTLIFSHPLMSDRICWNEIQINPFRCEKKSRKQREGKLPARHVSKVCGIYTYCRLKNTALSLQLLAEHFMRKMNCKKPKCLLCCPVFPLTSNKVWVILQCERVRAKGMRLLWWGAEKHSVKYKVWKLTEFSLWLLTELIGVEPRFSGCFHRQWALN